MNVSESLRTGIGVTLSEALGFGGMTTVVGLAIVFGILLILMIVLYLFKLIFYKSPEKMKKEVVTETASASEEDEEELVAVLTAAVAATLQTSANRVRINTYKRVHTDSPVWNRAGRKEAMENKL
ncbi:MAG: OadG family protein [Clostridia bacterium]|nr:OadG family protein [Clostridia bacterium]